MSRIKKISARQVLDSRGNPTIEAEVVAGTHMGLAIVPSGASVGMYESVELRDNGRDFFGRGVLKAIAGIRQIEKRLRGMDVTRQKDIDSTMIALDGTNNKSRLGANAILAVSLASARAAASAKGLPLYRYIAGITGNRPKMPIPFSNIINGGRHAGTRLAMQEFMIAPVKARTFAEAARLVSETYQTLKTLIEKRYGRPAVNVGDEGGFAPPIEKAEDALRLIKKAIEQSGNSKRVRIAVDAAASEFYNNKGHYMLHRQYTAEQLHDYYLRLVKRFDICSLEDPFDQDDFPPWQRLTKSSGIQIVGDDLLVTNPARIKMAIDHGLCNALLLKVNQIGTLTEALDAARLARKNRWHVMVSHRSGDTEDAFIADLAAGLGCGQIKIGAPCRGERTAKYNRLLQIEEQSGAGYASHGIP